MTVSRLLREATSMELQMWQHFLKADADLKEEMRERARVERDILGDEA